MTKQKSNKKGKKSKTKKIPFRLLDLPTELIENICGILLEQNRKKSLATLNVANRFLREVTIPFLWTSVRWTQKSWNFDTYFVARRPPVTFEYIRSIILVSPEREENHTGWWPLENLFWSPIVTTGLYVLPNATFGQLAHLWFPHLQFVVCLSASPFKTKQRGVPKACIHLSDQNVIEQHDLEALRGILLHTIREGSRREDALDGFQDLKLPLPHQASSLAAPALSESLAKLRTDLAATDNITSGHMVVNDSIALRRLVSIPLPDIELHIHLLTETSLEELEHKLRGKVFDVMEMTARGVAEDRAHSIESHVQVILGRDSSGDTITETADFFALCEKWLKDLSLHPQALDASHVTTGRISLTVHMDEMFPRKRFTDSALALQRFVAGLHAKAPEGNNRNLPSSIIVRGALLEQGIRMVMFARMQFASKELSNVVFLGRLAVKEQALVIERYYDGGVKVTDERRRGELDELFLAEQPDTLRVTIGPDGLRREDGRAIRL